MSHLREPPLDDRKCRVPPLGPCLVRLQYYFQGLANGSN